VTDDPGLVYRSVMNGRLLAVVVGLGLLVSGSAALAQPGGPPGGPPSGPPPGPPPGPSPGPPPGPQPAYTPPPTYAVAPMTPGRRGFMVGFSLGAGEIFATDCQGCDSLAGLGFDFSIGVSLTPNLAIMYDAFGVIRPEDGLVLTNATNVAALQFWITPTLWLLGGAGISQIRLSDGFGNSAEEYGFGVTVGGGIEVIRSDRFGLDLRLRLSHGTFDGGGLSNAAALVGFHWF
jgi:hypothetical protein